MCQLTWAVDSRSASSGCYSFTLTSIPLPFGMCLSWWRWRHQLYVIETNLKVKASLSSVVTLGLHCVFFSLSKTSPLCCNYTNKEKRKDTRSQSKHNFICIQTSYMSRLCTAIIRLNTELWIRIIIKCNKILLFLLHFIYSRNMLLVCTQINVFRLWSCISSFLFIYAYSSIDSLWATTL